MEEASNELERAVAQIRIYNIYMRKITDMLHSMYAELDAIKEVTNGKR